MEPLSPIEDLVDALRQLRGGPRVFAAEPGATVAEQFARDMAGDDGVNRLYMHLDAGAQNPRPAPPNIRARLEAFAASPPGSGLGTLAGTTFFQLARFVDTGADPERRVRIACGDAGFTRAQLDAARGAGRTARDLAREYLARGHPPADSDDDGPPGLVEDSDSDDVD